MSGRIDPAVWDERREWIERQVASGLSVAGFCREHGLHVGNFHAWKQKLAKDARVDAAASAVASGDGHHRPRQAFVQLPLPPAVVASGSAWIEVSLAQGTVVRVPASNLAALELVLSILQPSIPELRHA